MINVSICFRGQDQLLNSQQQLAFKICLIDVKTHSYHKHNVIILMKLDTVDYIHLANFLPIVWMIAKTIPLIEEPKPKTSLLATWITVVGFMLTWALFQNLLQEELYLSIAAGGKVAIAFFSESLQTSACTFITALRLKTLRSAVGDGILGMLCLLNFKVSRFLFLSGSVQQKKVMVSGYTSMFEGAPLSCKKEFRSSETQYCQTAGSVVSLSCRPIDKEEKGVQFPNAQKSDRSNQFSGKEGEHISFIEIRSSKSLEVEIQADQTQIICDLRMSDLKLDDVNFPGKSQEEHEPVELRRLNTYSHYVKRSRVQEVDWISKFDISVSEEYSGMFDSDDQQSVKETRQDTVPKLPERKHLFKKQLKLQRPNQTVNSRKSQKKPIAKAEIYLQTGNSYYKLQRRWLKLFQQNQVHICSYKDVFAQSFTLSRLRPLRGQFYQAKGTSATGPVMRIIRFRGEHSLFSRFLVN